MFRFSATSKRSLCRSCRAISLVFSALALTLLFAAGLSAQTLDGNIVSNVDARLEVSSQHQIRPNQAQQRAEQRWRRTVGELEIRFDRDHGTVRSLGHHTDYLTTPDPREPLAIADDFLRREREFLGLTAFDLDDYEITDLVTSTATGAHHLYLRQRHLGLPVYQAQIQVHINRDGRLIGLNNGFVRELAASIKVSRPKLDAKAAIQQGVADWLGEKAFELQQKHHDSTTWLRHPRVAPEGTEARLMWLPIRPGESRLVWNVVLKSPVGTLHDLTLDAADGKVWTRFAWDRHAASYRVYEAPLPDPEHGVPLPPADGRSLVIAPADSAASPLGWHVATDFRGNNVHAYEDRNGDDLPPDVEPHCGEDLQCDFDLDLEAAPELSLEAALSNVFYWTNRVHDVQYQYGFDEAAGNFQADNFAKGGLGGDAILAEIQDGGDNCNARFATPPDGLAPRLQLYTCNNTAPSRDSAFDNAVIVHEIGHGIVSRQVGGPSNSSCLNNAQQPDEGWGDWLGLVYTVQPGDVGSDPRGFATYLFGQGPDGPGIRPQPYSTDPAINTYTYASIAELGAPHGTGSVWAQVLWEAYWALVDQHGFDPDLAEANGGAGNQRALLYVNEGLKQTACSPTFVDARDGLLQAAIDNYGGEDICTLWRVFADFGLGVDAVSGGPHSTEPENGFGLPQACQCQPEPIAIAGEDRTICLGEQAWIGAPPLSEHTYAWSPTHSTSSQASVQPLSTTTYTLTATTSCGVRTDEVTLFVDDGSGGGFYDDFERGARGWTTTGLWHLASESSCANPAYASASHAFYYGQEEGCTYDTGAATTGTLTSPVISGLTDASTLSFDFLRQVESFSGGTFDRTEVEILHNAGTTTIWARDSTHPSSDIWQNSGAISLAEFAGQPIRARFRFDSLDGTSNSFPGWFIDNIAITGDSPCAARTAFDWDSKDLADYGSATHNSLAPHILDGGETLFLEGDRSYRTVETFDITPFSVLQFDFKSTIEGEVHAIGFDDNTRANDAPRLFQIFGTERFAGAIQLDERYRAEQVGDYVSFNVPVGEYYQGRQMHLILVTDHDRNPSNANSTFRRVRLIERPPVAERIDFSGQQFTLYAGQGGQDAGDVFEGGLTFELSGDRWLASEATWKITSRTVLVFEFENSAVGEIQAIGFDEDNLLLDRRRLFQIAGTQPWKGAYQTFHKADEGWRTIAIPVGEFYTGEAMRLILVHDDDRASAAGQSRFRNVRLYER